MRKKQLILTFLVILSSTPTINGPCAKGMEVSRYVYTNITTTTESSVSNNITEDIQNITTVKLESERSYREYFEYKVYTFVAKYFWLITNSPGFIANPMAITIALRLKPFNTSALYMIVLGLTDTLTCALRSVYRILDLINHEWSLHLCQVMFYCIPVCQVYSNYILVVWTIERFIAVVFPLKLIHLSTLKRVKIVLLITLLSVCLLNYPFIPETEISEIEQCQYSNFILTKWFMIENAYLIFIPMSVIFICNTTIIAITCKRFNKRKEMAKDVERLQRRAEEQTQLTITLLLITSAFLILHVPVVLVVIWRSIYPDPYLIFINSQHDFIKFYLFIIIAGQIVEIQNWINFFLYCISGRKYREEFLNIVCCGRREQSRVEKSRTTEFVTSVNYT